KRDQLLDHFAHAKLGQGVMLDDSVAGRPVGELRMGLSIGGSQVFHTMARDIAELSGGAAGGIQVHDVSGEVAWGDMRPDNASAMSAPMVMLLEGCVIVSVLMILARFAAWSRA